MRRSRSDAMAEARTPSAVASSYQTLVVIQTASRGTPLAASAAPTSRSLPYIRAVSMWRYPSSSASSTASRQGRPVTSHVPTPIRGTSTPWILIVGPIGTARQAR